MCVRVCVREKERVNSVPRAARRRQRSREILDNVGRVREAERVELREEDDLLPAAPPRALPRENDLEGPQPRPPLRLWLCLPTT